MTGAKFVRFKRPETGGVDEPTIFINTALITHAAFNGPPTARRCTLLLVNHRDWPPAYITIDYDPASVSRLENILSEGYYHENYQC
jgi:hypothetical protein